MVILFAAFIFSVGAFSLPSAEAAKVVLSTFGSAGIGAGQFGAGAPAGIAVNTTGNGGVPAGDVYVVDQGNNRVEEFSSDGTFVRAFGLDVGGAGVDVCAGSCQAGTASSVAGAFNIPYGVAVDQATGNLYVTDQGNLRVDVFSGQGTFEGAFGWGVRSGDSAPFTFDFCTEVGGCQEGQSGAGAGQFTLGTGLAPEGLGYPAVAPAGAPDAGDVIVADPQNHRIQEFAPTVTAGVVTGVSFVRAIGWGVLNGAAELQVCTATCQAGKAGAGAKLGVGQFAGVNPRRVAVDGAGAIYAVQGRAGGSCTSLAAFHCVVWKYAASGTSVSEFAPQQITRTSGTEVPSEVTVDAADNVYVAQLHSAPTEGRVYQLSTAGDLKESDGVGSGLPAANGIALGTAGNLYYVQSSGATVAILNEPPAPEVSIGEVTELGATSATFNGTVTPVDGFEARYHFEYSTNGIGWTSIPVPDASAGSGASPVSVHQGVTGLAPNTSYQLRLRATDGSAITSETIAFTTGTRPPAIIQERAAPVTSDSAELTAYVDPANSPTRYRVEWGPSTAYGHVVPAEFTPFVGDGNEPIPIAVSVRGLEPSTTYHFRVVAGNGAGTTFGADSPFETPVAECPNAAIRRQSPNNPKTGTPYSGGLPQCRAYERVTPADKQGHDAALFAATAAVAPDGGAVATASVGDYADPENTQAAGGNVYLSAREGAQWSTGMAFAPQRLIASFAGADEAKLQVSSDLTKVAMCGSPGENGEQAENAIVCALRTADGTWHSTPAYPNLVTGSGIRFTRVAASQDLSHIVGQLAHGGLERLLPSDTNSCTSCPGGGIYDLTGLSSGRPTLRLVDVDNSGAVIGPDSSTALGWSANGSGSPEIAYRSVSGGGTTIVFSASPTGGPSQGAPEQVFARLDDEVTVNVAGTAECGNSASCDVTEGPIYRGANSEGSRVFFTTAQPLVAGDHDNGDDLYQCEVPGDLGSAPPKDGVVNPCPHLVPLSLDESGTPAEVQGVAGMNADGSVVAFVASGVLTGEPNANGDEPSLGANNLYVVSTRSAKISFVASLPDSDARTLWSTGEASKRMRAQLTPSGRFLLFASRGRLTPDVTASEQRNVFRYDVATGTLIRVSTGEPDFPASSDNNTGLDAAMPAVPFVAEAAADLNQLDRGISDDGSSIIFTTKAQLQADDTNGATDVYLWHDGTVRLISDGSSTTGITTLLNGFTPASTAAMSASGSDIFFATRTRLVGQDSDDLADVYDARVGGGFPFALPSGCGDSIGCQGPASASGSSGASPGSATFLGPGNSKPKKPRHHRKAHKKHRRKKHHGKRHHRGKPRNHRKGQSGAPTRGSSR